MLPDPSSVKIYTVNGAASGSSSSIPDWLTKKRALQSKGKRRVAKEQVEGTIELVQYFEFPEASNRIKTTRDGRHAVATGTYKPQIRVWDLDQLSLKFERHSDAENVDFIMLSDDWTKSIHLQCDRSIELHAQGGLHYRTRIPRFGRTLAYHFPSCDALVGAAGSEVFRLNLDQGRFLNPLQLQAAGEDAVRGVNAIDVNPAHQLFSFGIDGNATVQFWDPRSRSRVGVLRLPKDRLMPVSSGPAPLVSDDSGLSVTAISSRPDGLSYAVGTSSGHTLLYDIRAARPLAMKDQGYGLPIKNVTWIEGGSRMAGDGLVLSADKKVIKIWDRNAPEGNLASITPAYDMNDVHHVPGSGLLMLANEGIQMTTYYIPALGPAPKWCSFLENITEELEDQTTRTAYQDYKFIERSELTTLGLDHLVGTPALKPYMHGYFLSMELYDAARVIANPYVYAEHRERVVREKMDKLAETRIRARKEPGVKVNKGLAEKILHDEERARKREEAKRERRAKKAAEAGEKPLPEAMDVDAEAGAGEEKEKPTLLSDPRFKALFENPDFQVDESSREFALMNPSAAAQRQSGAVAGARGRTKTAVEEEEEESDKVSSDGLGDGDGEGGSGEESGQESQDSDEAGELWRDDLRARAAAKASSRQANARRPQRQPNVHLVPLRTSSGGAQQVRDASFGQRRSLLGTQNKGKAPAVQRTAEGGMEMSFVPRSSGQDDDDLFDDTGNAAKGQSAKKGERRKGVETFGAGMEKGGEMDVEMNESERKGRTKRRTGMRSGSRNTFRRM